MSAHANPLKPADAFLALVVALFVAVHAPLARAAEAEAPPEPAPGDAGGLSIPSIEEMCAALGATSETLDACKFDEESAAEFVIAWMGLNGFIVDGAIDLAQIELLAELGPDPASPLTDPDPSLADPGLGEIDSGLEEAPDADPFTGLPVTQTFDSKAQIALECLGSSSDWIAMYRCISTYDPASRFPGP